MLNAIHRAGCIVSLALCVLPPLAQADMYKCKNAQGAVTFSGTPCAADAAKIATPTAPAVSTPSPTSAASTTAPSAGKSLIGKWRNGYQSVYEFKADGSLRTDETHSDFSVWRTGRWKLDGNNLVLSFTKIGGSVRDDSFSAQVSGVVEWDEEGEGFRFDHYNFSRVK